MSSTNWYETIEGSELLQGDLVSECPVLEPVPDAAWPTSDGSEVGARIKVLDFIVLSQSCDLANDKIEKILLGRVMSWQEVVKNEEAAGNTALKGRKFRKLLVDGSIPSLSLLHKHEDEPTLPWSVVDFHHLFSVPRAFLTSFAEAAGPRLRLRSPYREHLAQAFARYFMRVGLPHDAREFEKDGG